MQRWLLSLLFGLIAGGLAGLFIGWEVAPTEYINSSMTDLAERYQQEYTVMVAEGYLLDGDAQGAVDRLRVLGVANVPLHVQEVTEVFITNSRNIDDTRKLVALSEGLGRLTPLMEPFRELRPLRGNP